MKRVTNWHVFRKDGANSVISDLKALCTCNFRVLYWACECNEILRPSPV